jgi:hypothetical protein
MPGVIRDYAPPMDGNAALKEIRQVADRERKERKAAIDSLWKWREGHHPQTLEVEVGERDDNIYFNLCGQVVDDIGEFMGQPAIKVTDSEQAQKILDLTLKENLFAEMSADTIESGNVAGHNFVRLSIPDGTPMRGEMPAFAEAHLPEISLLDARYVSVFWDISRISGRKALLWYRLTWEVGKSIYIQDIVPDALVSDVPADIWWVIEYEGKTNSTKFTEKSRDQWPYPFAPIVDWKNARKPHSYYGQSTLTESTVRLNNSVNFIASNIGKIIKFHGHPKTIITGMADPADIDVRPDGLVTIPMSKSDGLDIQNLEMQSDLSASSNYLDKLEQRLFSERRVLDQDRIKDTVGGLTNFGVRMLYLNMLKMIEEKRQLYGDGFKELARRLLVMLGFDSVTIVTEWPESLPINRAEVVANTQTEKAIGVTSAQSLAKELGRDYEAELKQREEESEKEAELKTTQQRKLMEQGLFNPMGAKPNGFKPAEKDKEKAEKA